MATRDGTWAYRERFGESFGRAYFRRLLGGVGSSIGIGTYLGDPTDAVDDASREAIRRALESGVNVVDTAANYRCGRAERVVGEALRAADVDRESVLLASKAGFLPFDGERPDDPAGYVSEAFVEPGLVDPEDLVHGSHCIAPAYLDAQLDRSLSAIGVETLDCYYVHNPETQLASRPRRAVYDQLEAAFEALERRVADGDLRAYGVATWTAFRVPSDDPRYLSLPAVVRAARRAAGVAGNDTTGLGAVQLPFNVQMADAYTLDAHSGPNGPQSALAFCRDAGLPVLTSASLGQGELADGLPEAVAAELPGRTPPQRALNFARSAPGVATALVGMASPGHVEENVAAGEFDAMGAEAFEAVFE